MLVTVFPLNYLFFFFSLCLTLGTTSSPYLFAEVGPFQGDHADVNCVGDKRLVVHELVRGEGGDGVQKKLGGLLEVPDGHAVQTLVDLQAVPPVPVPALLDEAAQRRRRSTTVTRRDDAGRRMRMREDEPLGFFRVACDEVTVHVEEADPQQVEDDV